MTTFDKIQRIINDFSKKKKIALALSTSNSPLTQNMLYGNCSTYTNKLLRFAKRKYNLTLPYSYSLSFGHAFTEHNTSDRGTIIIDPTLGQFIIYPRVFIGTKTELL